MFPIQSQRTYKKPHPLHIPWSVAEKAYSRYCAEFGRGQSLETLARRGGFSPSEMDLLHPNWIEESSEITRLRAVLKLHTDFAEKIVHYGAALISREYEPGSEVVTGLIATARKLTGRT